MLKTHNLLGVKITNGTTEEILEYVYRHLEIAEKRLFIVTPNPEIIVHAHTHPDYKKLLNEANIALPDGIGVFLASGLTGNRIEERIPGVYFMEELCRKSDGKALSIGLLGGGRGIAKRTAECLRRKYPWIRIAFVGSEWPNELFIKRRRKQSEGIHDVLQSAKIDILFVAYGFPKQEEWIYQHLDELPVKAAMGVGGSFDYISGNVPRAPYIIRAMGFEWLYRLIRQPWRIKRQLALLTFIRLVISERFKK